MQACVCVFHCEIQWQKLALYTHLRPYLARPVLFKWGLVVSVWMACFLFTASTVAYTDFQKIQEEYEKEQVLRAKAEQYARKVQHCA